MSTSFPVSPLSLDCLTRDYWGAFDAAAIAQLAPLAENKCYQPKIYRAPALSDELVEANGYVSYGLKITPGAIIYGFYLPPGSPFGSGPLPPSFNVQITDQSLRHKWFDQPVPSYFLGNCKPTFLSGSQDVMGSAPNLLVSPYPVVGTGLFLIEIWNTFLDPATSPALPGSQRIELVFGVFEPIGEACR